MYVSERSHLTYTARISNPLDMASPFKLAIHWALNLIDKTSSRHRGAKRSKPTGGEAQVRAK